MHGVDNVLALVESEIVAALGIRIATLGDDTSIPAGPGKPKSRGDRAIARLLGEAVAAGTEVKAVGLSRSEVLYYLDDEVCRQAAPRFPGWETATVEHADSGTHEPWKRWVASRYSLALSRDNIRYLAAECRRRRKILAELAAAIQVLAACAAESRP